MSLIGVIDLIALCGFGAASVFVMTMARRMQWREARRAHIFGAAAMGLYFLTSVSNSFEHLGITEALDPIEDYLELLFMPLLLYVGSLWTSAHDKRRLEHALRIQESEHGLLENIMDTSPTAIIVADAEGRITFANEQARMALELEEHEGMADIPAPPWQLRDMRDLPSQKPTEPGRFRLGSPVGETQEGVVCVLSWPDGQKRMLSVNSRPLSHPDETANACVIAFEDVTYRKTIPEDI